MYDGFIYIYFPFIVCACVGVCIFVVCSWSCIVVHFGCLMVYSHTPPQEEDMALIYGVHKHGLGDYTRLLMDEDLVFSKNEEALAAHQQAIAENIIHEKGIFFLDIYFPHGFFDVFFCEFLIFSSFSRGCRHLCAIMDCVCACGR